MISFRWPVDNSGCADCGVGLTTLFVIRQWRGWGWERCQRGKRRVAGLGGGGGGGGAMEGRLRFTVYRERSGKTFDRKTGIWDCNWGRVRVSEDETSPGCVWKTDT